MPSPESATENRTAPFAAPTARRTSPPAGEYLIALSRRLSSTWRSCASSAATGGRAAARAPRDRRDAVGRLVQEQAHAVGQVRSSGRDDALAQRVRVTALDVDVEAAGVELAREEQVVHDRREARRLLDDDVEEPRPEVVLQLDVLAVQREGGAVDRGEWRAELVRDGGDDVLAHLLEHAFVGDVLERVDDAVVERDAGDGDPAIVPFALERQRLHPGRCPLPGGQQVVEPAADDLLAPDPGNRLGGAVPQPHDPVAVDDEDAVGHGLENACR